MISWFLNRGVRGPGRWAGRQPGKLRVSAGIARCQSTVSPGNYPGPALAFFHRKLSGWCRFPSETSTGVSVPFGNLHRSVGSLRKPPPECRFPSETSTGVSVPFGNLHRSVGSLRKPPPECRFPSETSTGVSVPFGNLHGVSVPFGNLHIPNSNTYYSHFPPV